MSVPHGSSGGKEYGVGMNSKKWLTDGSLKDRSASLRLNEIFDGGCVKFAIDDMEDTDKLPDLPDYSPEEVSNTEHFSFAVLPPPKATPPAVAPPGPAPVSPGSKAPGRVASAPLTTAPSVFIATPASARSVTIATPFSTAATSVAIATASASPCTTAPLVLNLSPTNNKSIFASSIGSSIPIGTAHPTGTAGRKFSLQHIGLSETESKRISEVARSTPPATPQTTLLPRSNELHASRARYRDHANRTPYSRRNVVPFQNMSSSSPSSKSRAGQQETNPFSVGTRSLVVPDAAYTESVVVSDVLVARILAFYHLVKMNAEFDVKICRNHPSFMVSGKINAVKSAVNKLGDLESQVKSSVVKLTCPLECHYLPLFNDDLAIKVADIEKLFCVQIEVVSHSGGLKSIGEFCKAMKDLFSSKEATQACSLRDYLTTPHSHKWYEVIIGTQNELELPEELNEALNLSYAPGSVVQVSYSDSELLVDFSKMMITMKQSHTNIKVVPSYWFRVDDNFGLVDLDKALSEAIEAFLLYGMPVLVDGKCYNVDLERMKLIDKQSKEETPICRVPQFARQLYAPSLVIFLVSGLKEDASKASDKLHALLNEQTVKKELPLTITGAEAVKNAVFSKARQYCIKISREKEKLVLEGSPDYTEKVTLPVQNLYIELLAKSSTALPSHWDEMAGKIELKAVPRSSDEFKKVLSLMKETLKSAQIVKLERIQNQWLWDRYAFAKQRMAEKNGGEVNEKELFHGTSKTPPEKIYRCEQGFDFRHAVNGMWGTGAYFALNASYSDSYAYHANSNQKQMFLALVLTGDAIESKPDKMLTKPPLKIPVEGSAFKDERYDSVTGTTRGSKIYVVYDHDKSYPSYLITYK